MHVHEVVEWCECVVVDVFMINSIEGHVFHHVDEVGYFEDEYAVVG